MYAYKILAEIYAFCVYKKPRCDFRSPLKTLDWSVESLGCECIRLRFAFIFVVHGVANETFKLILKAVSLIGIFPQAVFEGVN